MDVLNQVGRPVWLVLMVIGFIWFWPVGLVILAYLVWSGRLGSSAKWAAPWNGAFWGSGNAAFDEHRADTLARLETEQKQFGEFVEKLRAAKDKSEFDQFMADQRAQK